MDSTVAAGKVLNSRIELIGWERGEPDECLLSREWLVTNGLGGYACGTLAGVCTRRYHGLLVAALPVPFGRYVMLNHLEEHIVDDRGRERRLSGDEPLGAGTVLPDRTLFAQFRLHYGLPVWRFGDGDFVLEKSVLMPHRQNTTYVTWRLLQARHPLTLRLRPSHHFRPHEQNVSVSLDHSYRLTVDGSLIEVAENDDLPPVRLALAGAHGEFRRDEKIVPEVLYRVEQHRGYEAQGRLWTPGEYSVHLEPGASVTLIVSTEPLESMQALSPLEAFQAERERRNRLLRIADVNPEEKPLIAQLVLAADQFVISPQSRPGDAARAAATGDEPRTVIAGYHWFTDWGRDTMISLEGLTLSTGRTSEGKSILRTFAHYVRDGLIPNMFPEGEHEGLYHTADATLWFFQAMHRYVSQTGDRETLCRLLPKFNDIIDHHLRGTRFGIAVDPADGLLRQGAEGYQLTWMDAKVDGWVVTPRRGKAVEINALFYNALRLTERWVREEGDVARAEELARHAARVEQSFNARFWYDEGGYLYDVVDTEGGGNDPALRPNQIFAISLENPVLDRSRWKQVMDVALRELVTPVGLRSLSRSHPDYKPVYQGDLRTRDAAYHQGTVWGWLIGPFIDAWMKVHPNDRDGARQLLEGFTDHLGEACIGTVSEIFDAEHPYTARGCVAQAWSVAELLRCWRRIEG